jgi:hypothetical protein
MDIRAGWQPAINITTCDQHAKLRGLVYTIIPTLIQLGLRPEIGGYYWLHLAWHNVDPRLHMLQLSFSLPHTLLLS